MMKHLAPALLLTALASCGSAGKDNQMNDSTTVAQFTMSSSDIKDGQPIPQAYTCDGADQSPQLSWPEPPPGTRSFALIVDDPDAPSGTFRHWGVFNIPDTRTSIDRGEGNGPSNTNFVQAVNGFGKSGYGGPCPPKGHGPHHYHFKLYALDVDGLKLPPDAKVEQVEQAAREHQIAVAEITGTYERK
jgi:Raf kinase inhibitor-like YbhB/YbcL family protein